MAGGGENSPIVDGIIKNDKVSAHYLHLIRSTVCFVSKADCCPGALVQEKEPPQPLPLAHSVRHVYREYLRIR